MTATRGGSGRSALAWALALACSCGDSDDGDDTAGDTAGDTTTATATATASGSGSATMSTTATASGTDASGSQSGSSSDDGADSGGSEAETGGAVECGEIACGSGEVCVQPCCGGPAPACNPLRGVACPPGTQVVDSCYGDPCDGVCCLEDPCTPAPAYCAAMDELDCSQDPNSPTIECNTTSCYGELVDGTLSCQCA